MAHLIGGYVISTPEVFLLFRPVDSRRPDLFDDPWAVFEEVDTWFCYLAAGDLSQFGRFMPYPLPFVAWNRKNSLRFHTLPQTRFLHGWQKETRERSGSGERHRSAVHEATGRGGEGCPKDRSPDRSGEPASRGATESGAHRR